MQTRFTGRLADVIRLICPIRADPEPLIEWYRVREIIWLALVCWRGFGWIRFELIWFDFQDGERVTEFWDRYRIGSKGFSLTIQRLECDDEGTYVCKAINGFGVHEISFQLNLSSKFRPVSMGNQRKILKKKILPPEPTLNVFESIAIEDGANEEMVCDAGSSGRSASETSHPVADTSRQVPVMLHKQKKNRLWLKPAGSYALLKCTATANPLPKIRWFKVSHLHPWPSIGADSY